MQVPFVPVGTTGYYVFELDAAGYERTPGAIASLQEHVASASYTDIVVLSHGYATSKLADGSVYFCTKVVDAMEKERPEGSHVLYVGVHWPSSPRTLFQGAGKGARERFESMFRDYTVKEISEDDEKGPAADITTLSDEGLAEHVEFVSRDTASDGEESTETDIAGPSNQEKASDVDVQEELSPSTDEVVNRAGNTASVAEQGITSISKKNGAINIMQEAPAKMAKTTRRWYNSFTYNVFFKQFERRAGIVGSLGVHGLLAKLMESTKTSVKFHLFGHSLGGHVVCSSAIGREPRSFLTRKIHTLMIAQGAIDARSFAEGGAYRLLVSHLKPVAGPVLATKSPFDGALKAYKFFSTAPMGLLGIKDPLPARHSEFLLRERGEERVKRNFNFNCGEFYTLDGQLIITEAKPDVFGVDFDRAHGDIVDPETMWAFWSACQTKLRGGERAYRCADPETLPKDIWQQRSIQPENDFFGCCMF